MWILIVISMLVSGAPAGTSGVSSVTSTNFTSKEACDKAVVKIYQEVKNSPKNFWIDRSDFISAFCVPSGAKIN